MHRTRSGNLETMETWSRDRPTAQEPSLASIPSYRQESITSDRSIPTTPLRAGIPQSVSLPTILSSNDDDEDGDYDEHFAQSPSATHERTSVWQAEVPLTPAKQRRLSSSGPSPSNDTHTTANTPDPAGRFLRHTRSSTTLGGPKLVTERHSPSPWSPTPSISKRGHSSYTPPVRRKLPSTKYHSVSNLKDITKYDAQSRNSSQADGSPHPTSTRTGKLDLSVWEWKPSYQSGDTLANTTTTTTATTNTPSRTLPAHPDDWNAHETAHYIAQCLSQGINPDPTSAVRINKLPPLVVEDITEWVKRGRVTGKAFLLGSDAKWR